MIAVEGLRKQYGRTVAVEDVSFVAQDGCVTGVLGPNGAGKTTSFRVIAGLVQPDRGCVQVGGHDPARHPREARRRLGVLPEGGELYARLTAREHLRYAGALHGLAPAALEASVARLIADLEMQEIADRRAAGLSHGERRRVALGRALVHEPRNLLLDEPTNGLDVMGARAVRRLVRRLADDGRCVVFSSHVMQEVAAVCDRIVIVGAGRVRAAGTPEEVRAWAGRDSLEDAFVALLGSEAGLQ